MLDAVILLCVALLIIYFTYLINKWRHPKCNGVLPPGSMGLPILGESLQLLIPSYSLDLHPFIKKRIKRYGPIFRSNVAGQPIVFSADPEFNNYIICQERKLVEFWYLDTFSKLLVFEGESNTSGATDYIDKYIRSLYLSYFGSERLKQILLPQIEDTIHKTLRSWSTQESIEVKRSASAVAADFTAKSLFNYDAEKSSYNISEYLAKFMESVMTFPMNIPGTTYHQCLGGKKKLMNMLESVVTERSTSAEKTNQEDILNQMLNDMKREKFVTKDFIVNILFGGLFAASESVPVTIAFLFKFLSAHPSVIEELTAEHEKILKERRGSESSITWDEYKSMTFTLQVIHETLRILAPELMRRALKDIQYKGYTIPAGWTIVTLSSTRHMNPEIYKDPLAFDPWRWKDLDPRCISNNFTPFGGGGRQCVGAEYSRLFLSIFLHVLVTNYRWTYYISRKERLVEDP